MTEYVNDLADYLPARRLVDLDPDMKLVAEVVDELIEGLTDPSEVTWQVAANAALLLGDAVMAAATAYLIREARAGVRSRVLRIERRAASDAEAPRAGEYDGDYYRGPHGGAYKHGTMKAVRAGCDCERCAATVAFESGMRQKMYADLQKATDSFASALRMEWTAELLSSSFALSDGSTVTWGEATADQHAARVELLHKNAAGNIEAAARHTKAIAAITTSGVRSLSEAVA